MAGRTHATSPDATLQIALLRVGLGLTLRETARRLNEAGVPTDLGGKWYASTVRSVERRMKAQTADA